MCPRAALAARSQRAMLAARNQCPGTKKITPRPTNTSTQPRLFASAQAQFAPVAPEVYNFEVSGLKVVQHWLDYRMREPKGKKSSPLDDIHPEKWTRDFTDELLELLWILEATIAEYPRQARLLTRVAKGRKIRL